MSVNLVYILLMTGNTIDAKYKKNTLRTVGVKLLTVTLSHYAKHLLRHLFPGTSVIDAKP